MMLKLMTEVMPNLTMLQSETGTQVIMYIRLSFTIVFLEILIQLSVKVQLILYTLEGCAAFKIQKEALC